MASQPRIPVDCLCLWSEWFQRRLLSISSIYTHENTCVTGRLRGTGPVGLSEPRAVGQNIRVLALMEDDSAFVDAAEPYLMALDEAPGISLLRREHPASGRGLNQSPLREQLLASDIVFGVRSSALWEAVAYRLPVVVPMTALDSDQDSLADAGALMSKSPSDLVKLVLELSTQGLDHYGLAAAHRRVWGDAERVAPTAICDVLHRKFDVDVTEKSSGISTSAG